MSCLIVFLCSGIWSLIDLKHWFCQELNKNDSTQVCQVRMWVYSTRSDWGTSYTTTLLIYPKLWLCHIVPALDLGPVPINHNSPWAHALVPFQSLLHATSHILGDCPLVLGSVSHDVGLGVTVAWCVMVWYATCDLWHDEQWWPVTWVFRVSNSNRFNFIWLDDYLILSYLVLSVINVS